MCFNLGYSSAFSVGFTSVSISLTFSSCLRRSNLSGPYVEGICQKEKQPVNTADTLTKTDRKFMIKYTPEMAYIFEWQPT